MKALLTGWAEAPRLQPAAAAQDLFARHAVLIGWLSVLLGALPLAVTAPAALEDWPGHLARVWVIHQVLQGDPFWSAHYLFRGFLIPNAIIDLALAGLQQAGLAIQTAGTLYLLALYALFVGGFHRLARAAGAQSALTLPLAAGCFYTLPLFWGFVNFMTGISVMLWLLAWSAEARSARHRLALALAGTAAVAFCHIIAAALFVGVLGCLDLVRLGRARWRTPLVLAPSCLAALVVLAAVAGSPVAGNSLHRIVYRGHGTAAGVVFGKVSIWGKTLLSLHVGPDAMLVLAFVPLAALAWRLRPCPALPWAVAAGALALVSLAAPDWIGASAFLDARIPAVAVVVLAATTPLQGAAPALAMALCACLAGRSAWLATDFAATGRSFAALETALSSMPPGSTLLAADAQKRTSYTWWSFWPPQVTLMTPHGVFVPKMFAIPVQQPLVLRLRWEPWNYFLELTTPARFDAAMAEARASCEGPTSMILFYPLGVPASLTEGRLPGALGQSLRLVKVC